MLQATTTTHKRPRRRIYKSDKIDQRIRTLRRELGLNLKIEELNYKIKTDLKWINIHTPNAL